MNKRYLYIIIGVIIISFIGLLIYKASNKNKPIDINNVTDEDIQRIINSIDKKEFNIDEKDFANVQAAIELARKLGVPEEKIIKNIRELDAYMND